MLTDTRKVAVGLFAGLLMTGVAAFAGSAPDAAPVPEPEVPAQPGQAVEPAQSPDSGTGEQPTPAPGVLPEPEEQVCTNYECSGDYQCQTYCGQAGGQCGSYFCPGVCFCYF